MDSFFQILKALREDQQAGETLGKLIVCPVNPDAIQTLLSCDAKDAASVAAAIRGCPTLTAQTLAASNAIGFRDDSTLYNLDDTIRMFESHRTRALALAFGSSMLTYHSAVPENLIQDYWSMAQTKAVAARKLCESIQPEWAMTAHDFALIQDIGIASLMMLDPILYQEHFGHDQTTQQLLSAEAQHFGITHPTAGMVMLGKWQGDDSPRALIERSHQSLGQDLDVSIAMDVVQYCVRFSAQLPHSPENPFNHKPMTRAFSKWLVEDYEDLDDFLSVVESEADQFLEQLQPDEPLSMSRLTRRSIRSSMQMSTYMMSSFMRLDAKGKESHHQMSLDLQELRSKAFTDQLSGLLNRYGFNSLAKNRLQQAWEDNSGACCILVDMDDFKSINDTYGHAVGDKMIKGLAILMRRSIRKGDLIGRLGGDEFAALVCGVDADRAFQLGNLLSSKVEGRSIKVADGLELELHASLGVVYIPDVDESTTIEQLLGVADEAMYRRKHSGKNGVCFMEINAKQLAASSEVMPGTGISGMLANSLDADDSDVNLNDPSGFLPD